MSLYAEDLSCSVCLSLFTDPVSLACGHSFCRGCLAGLPSARCPQCRAALPPAAELQRLVTNHILKSLAQKARESPLLTHEARESPLLTHEARELQLLTHKAGERKERPEVRKTRSETRGKTRGNIIK
ncbi:hypothetical protein WMY93_027821 [Mugilogobius chulae]|uniref:RING-type domain-containing protein n=1 Tax=Mugilogobius chulae TaxID=88201 RepID=A0AAW0MYN3_9GOBI